MLNHAQISRMIEAPDLEKAFFVLNETCYSEHTSAVSSPFDFEVIFRAELLKQYMFLRYYARGDEVFQKFWRKYDYGNAKILIRAWKKKIEDISDRLINFGEVDAEVLSTFILKGEGVVPKWLEKAINDAIIVFEEEENPAEIDRVLDQAYLKDLKESGNGLLMKLAEIWSEVPYPFNQEGDDRTFGALKQVKRKAFGVDPLITFWLAKEFEARTIYRILVGKKHYINDERIKERAREMYV